MKPVRLLQFVLVLIGLALTALPVVAEPAIPAVRAPYYFAVLVEDVEASAAWYAKTLGLEEGVRSRADDDAWEIVNLGNADLAVELIRDSRAQDVRRAFGFFKVGFAVPDVDVVADRVEEETGTRPRIVEFEPQQIRILQLKDPGGNTIQLSSPLAGQD